MPGGGVDMVDSAFARGKADTASAGVAGPISFVQGELESLPIRSGACDMVWCRDTLEHIGDPGGFMRECGRVLRPGKRAGSRILDCAGGGSGAWLPL